MEGKKKSFEVRLSDNDGYTLICRYEMKNMRSNQIYQDHTKEFVYENTDELIRGIKSLLRSNQNKLSESSHNSKGKGLKERTKGY